MEYKRYDNYLAIRLDKNEEIIASLNKIINDEGINSGIVNAIGATNDFTINTFNTTLKKYQENNFKGTYEIVSLTGNITLKDNEPYIHLHMACADNNGNVVGGHLKSSIISATLEMFITIIDKKINRKYDLATGLNLMEFDK